MAERIGVQAVFDLRLFDAGLKAYNAGLAVAHRATASAASSLNVFGQIATGALREIGHLVTRGLVRAGREALRFASNLISAAADGSALETSLGQVYSGLVNVTKVSFSPLFDQLDGIVQKAGPAFLGFVQFAEQALAGFASNAIGYGENIVGSLAQGMWNAVGFVVDVLTNIGNLIASWLAPGSPPKLLPDLDDWGTEAMEVWLSGWSKADFGIFREIGGTLEALIRSVPVSDDAGRSGIIPRILGTREGIARAVDELRTAGQVSAETLDNIIGQVGTADDGVRAYLTSLIGLEAANQDLANAQGRLAQVTAEYNALLDPIEDKLSSIDEAQLQLAEDQQKSLLQLTLQDPNASPAQKRQAQLELERIDAERARRALLAEKAEAVSAAEADVSAAEDAASAAQDQFDAQKALIDLQVEQNRLIGEQMALLDRLASAGAGGGGGGAAPKAPGGGAGKPGGIGFEPDLSPIAGALAGLQAMLAPLQEAWANAWSAIRETLNPAVEAWDNYVMPAWNRLKDSIVDSLPDLENAVAEMVAFVVSNMGITLPTIFENVGSSLDTLARIWEKHHDTFIAIVVAAFKIIFTTINVTLTLISGIIAVALRLIEGTLDTWSLALKGDWAGVWNNVKQTLSDAWDIIKGTLEGALNAILAIVGQDLETFKENWSGVFTLAGTIITTLADIVSEKITIIWNAISEKLAAAGEIVDTFFASIKTFWEWLTGRVFSFEINLPEIPDWLIPGSPTPFERGIRGISNALREANTLASASLGMGSLYSSAALSSPATFGGGSSYTDARSYNLGGVHSARASQGLISDFAILEALGG